MRTGTNKVEACEIAVEELSDKIYADSIEFIESDDMIGFQKGGRVYCKEFIEYTGTTMIKDGVMYLTEIIERT